MCSARSKEPVSKADRLAKGRVSKGAPAPKGRSRFPDPTDRAIQLLFEGLDTPRSLACALLYKYGEHEQLVKLKCHPDNYDDVRSFRSAYIATSFLSKAAFLKTGIDLEKVAIDGFIANEKVCRQTNNRFILHATRAANQPLEYFANPEVRRRDIWITRVQRKIMQVLGGDFPLDEWFDACAWGPGATSSMKGDDTGPERKFLSESGITNEFHQLLEKALPALSPLWAQTAAFTIVPGSRISTVPKNAKTHRVTAAEPGWNVYFQLGIGKLIARRLLKYGIDLNDQGRNQRLAHYASRANHLATVDFSSASDTIATELIRELFALVPDWLHAMEVTRSKFSLLQAKEGDYYFPETADKLETTAGTWIRLEKFSSMGNGFTFALQSLVFFACALVACEGTHCSTEYVGVFGDDVVIPSPAYEEFSQMCAYFGFTIGSDKSFVTGYFRESCGSHYYGGVDVKPLYLKERVSDVKSAFRLANGVRDLASRGFPFGRDGRFRHLWVALCSSVPEKERFFVPDGYGDRIGFRVDFDEECPSTKLKRWNPAAGRRRAGGQVEGYWFSCSVETSVTYEADHVGVHLARLATNSRPKDDDFGNKPWLWETPNGITLATSGDIDTSGVRLRERAYSNTCTYRRRTKTRKGWLLARSWPTRGPWLY